MNIMQRLLLIVLLAAIPVGVLQVVGVRQDRREQLDNVSGAAISIAQRAAAEQRRIAEGARQLLNALSQLPAVRERDGAACNLIVRRLKTQFPIYTVIGVADDAGRVWCSSEAVGTKMSDRPYFRQAMANRRFTTGGYVVGRATGKRTLNFSLPLIGAGGTVTDLLVAGLDVDRLAADLSAARLPPGSSLAIYGPGKRLLVNLPSGDGPGTFLPRALEPAFRAAAPGIMRARWLDGSDRLIAFVPPAAYPEMPFLIAVGVDRAAAVAAVESRAYRAMMVVLAVVAAAMLSAWWIATRYVRRPIERLGEAIRAWRGGNTAARIGPLDPGSELGELARAFDALADTVEERQRRLHDALESTTDRVVAIAPDWVFTYFNGRAAAQVPSWVIGRKLWDCFPELADEPIGDALRTAMTERRAITTTFESERLGGRFESNIYPASDGGLIVFSRDITEQHRAERELQRLAHNDPVTGLPNRAHAMAVARHKAADGLLSAVLLLDLDNFKHVNDSLGHPAGDELLNEVARRLSTCLGDAGMVARFGGDEFVALLFKTGTAQSIALSRALLAALEQEPVAVRGRLHRITASCGLVLVRASAAAGIEELVANADIALYRAKRSGGGSCHTYSTADRSAYQARRQLEDEIARAAETTQFELYYQPQIRLSDGALAGAEALLRWRHPERGLLPPSAFIDVLEASRHAATVGTWIVDAACRDAAQWAGAGFQPRISVNLFAQQLRASDLPAVAAAALDRHGLPPQALELELTETIALAAEAGMRETLLALRRMGVRLAFDDFGTGFASLTTLKALPVDRLKIDRSFVAQLPSNGHDKAIVEAVLALARTLALEVVAEGVETAAQEEYLRGRGCQEAQGFRYARPMPAAEFANYVRAAAPRARTAANAGL